MAKYNAHLETKSLADLLVQLDRSIHYAVIIDNSNTVVECKGHETFALPLPLETLIDFASIGPLLVLGSMGHKMESACGRMGYVIGRFENALVIIYQLRSCMVVVVSDPIIEMSRIEEIGTFLRKWEKENAS